MNQVNYYSIQSTIELKFNNPETRDISYNSFLPEYNELKSKRSKIIIKKKNNSLIFYIKSTDITAFRASINDIIALGKIIEQTIKMCE
ncbi:MAG: KEOPS complex subunit Pcc1 [Promethearchaeota archaeon]